MNVGRMTSPTGAGWVGEGLAIPVRQGAVDQVTLGKTKVAAITLMSREQMRFSSVSTDAILRDDLARATAAQMDASFVGTGAGSAAVPAGLLNGVTGTASAGADADSARQDLQDLFDRMSDANIDDADGVIITTAKLARALSIMTTITGASEFPGAGRASWRFSPGLHAHRLATCHRRASHRPVA